MQQHTRRGALVEGGTRAPKKSRGRVWVAKEQIEEASVGSDRIFTPWRQEACVNRPLWRDGRAYAAR